MQTMLPEKSPLLYSENVDICTFVLRLFLLFSFNIYIVYIVYRFHNTSNKKPLVYIIYILFRIQLAGTWEPMRLIKASAMWPIKTHNRNELTTYMELNEKHLNRLPKHNNKTKTFMNTKRYHSAEKHRFS